MNKLKIKTNLYAYGCEKYYGAGGLAKAVAADAGEKSGLEQSAFCQHELQSSQQAADAIDGAALEVDA